MNNFNIIKSINYSQHTILLDIMKLFNIEDFECDVTYGKGNFYKNGVPEPTLKFDINPQFDYVEKADCRNLPIDSNSLNNLIFDPPFCTGPPTSSVMRKRYGCVRNMKELYKFYSSALEEFYRVLYINGLLIVKCQDAVESGRNHFLHIHVINKAEFLGFETIDLFILLAKNRLNGYMKHQEHARKYHSYFVVFKKGANVKPKRDST